MYSYVVVCEVINSYVVNSVNNILYEINELY